MFRDPFPILSVPDLERSLRFCRDLLGFEMTYRWPEDGPLAFAFLRLGAQGLGLSRRGATAALPGSPLAARPESPVELCLYVDDTGAASAHLLDGGAAQLVPPTDMPWGERLTYFADPDGNPIHIAMRLP